MELCYFINNSTSISNDHFISDIAPYIPRITVVVCLHHRHLRERCLEKMTRGLIGQIASLPVLMTLILFYYTHISFIETSYGAQLEEGIRTLAIKAYLENVVIRQGEKQTIHFQVADQKSHQPIGGAITSATVSYADGKTVKHISVPTDASGSSSISWRVESNAPDGRYDVLYSVFETGYVSESFGGGSFTVVANSVNDGCQSLSPSSSSSSLSLSPSSSSHYHVC